MTNYYIEKDEKIVRYGSDRVKFENTLKFMPEYQGLEIKETERPLVLSDDMTYYVFADDEEYQQEQAQKEAARIAMLNLTRGDVFRGLLLAKGITKNQIAQMIEAMPVSTQEEIVTKELALIDFEDALNFYRGNQLIDTIGLALGITSKQLDKFFEAGTSDDTEIKADAYLYLTTVTFIVEPTPATATVTINGETATTLAVPYGSTVEYTVTAEGYSPKSGSMVVVNNTSIDVELEPEPITEEPEIPVDEVENEDTTDTES